MISKMQTHQLGHWEGSEGEMYTDRNPQSATEEDQAHVKEHGLSRTAMNEEFLSGIDRSSRILEVGANIGLQLEILRNAGYTDLLGIEVNAYAVNRAKHIHPNVDIIKGSGFELPFRDGWFDIVYTSGVLIHIAPPDTPVMLREIYRVSRRFIWGFEYYAPELTEVEYRGKKNLLWKRNFAALYKELFPDLRLVKERKFPILGSDNVDQMFLLEKTSAR